MEQNSKSSTAVIVLHEIYGINPFIEEVKDRIQREGYDVFLPNIYGRKEYFPYENAQEAYSYFMEEVGFDAYTKITAYMAERKAIYEKVIVVGFSIGATIAWRCSESMDCDGVICCYGSRIRDYMEVSPNCPTYLLFAERDSFDVSKVCSQLDGRSNVEIIRMDAKHGFLDRFSTHYDEEKAALFDTYRKKVLQMLSRK